MCYERSLCDGNPPIWAAMEEFSMDNDPTGDLLDAYIKQEILKYRSQLEIPNGVHLMSLCGMIPSDIPRFMIFAKWWIKGEMTEEIFNLFCYHYEEVVEVDYFWVLMDEPGNYYGDGLECRGEDSEFCGFSRLEGELRRIGTRSKKKAKLNFQMSFGHD